MATLSNLRKAKPNSRPSLRPWISALLCENSPFPIEPLPLEAAQNEGLLPWLAYRLHDSGALDSLPKEQQEELRESLRRWNLLHLVSRVELERLAVSAQAAGLRWLAFKGHSVARTLYPHPACRPTSDFDLIIDPQQMELAHNWIAAQGYVPEDPFAGTIWLGQQAWWLKVNGNTRFAVDLHWDYTNRMYFRHRLSFDDIWAASREVPCGSVMLRVPCRVDDLIFACVHLAAFDPGVKVRLIWLLDIYLLMESLDESQVDLLLERAGRAHAIEACLLMGQMAAKLGDAAVLEPVLRTLRAVAKERRMRAYDRTLRWRAIDLMAYWLRLPVKGKIGFFGDLVRWIRVR